VLDWRARDGDGSTLSYAVLVSPDGQEWWPAAYGVPESEYVLDTRYLPPGEYRVQVLAMNSIRVGRSNLATLRVGGKT
jgi:hypothetical protein